MLGSAARGNLGRREKATSLAGASAACHDMAARAWAAERGGGPYAPLMTSAALRLTDADIEALAAWFSNR